MIVVDTNLIGHLDLENSSSLLAEQVFLRDPHWVAPIFALARIIHEGLWRVQQAEIVGTLNPRRD
jgi:hypothetical protein